MLTQLTCIKEQPDVAHHLLHHLPVRLEAQGQDFGQDLERPPAGGLSTRRARVWGLDGSGDDIQLFLGCMGGGSTLL